MLIDDARLYLNEPLTGDEDKDLIESEKLELAISTGKRLLDSYAGVELAYEEAGAPKQLLLDYLRYWKAQATEMFEVNYKRDLIALREEAEVIRYAAEVAAEESSDV